MTAALALCALSTPGLAQDDSSLRDPLARACDPQSAIEIEQYGLQGTTWLAVDLGDDGRPGQVRLHRSSGWKLLDDTAMRTLRGCRFDPAGDPIVRRRDIKMAYKWAVAPSKDQPGPATIVAGSCGASDRFRAFRPVMGDVSASKGVLVRFLVDPAGKPFGMKFEDDTPPATQLAGAAYLQSCRYTPAQGKAGPAQGTFHGRLIPTTV